MSWRVVRIESRAKLDYKMKYLVCRKPNEISKVFIEEITALIIESTSISITAALMEKLIEHKVKVIFCDEKRNPSFELMPYYGSHDTSLKVREQALWSLEAKQSIWTYLAEKKIYNQMKTLEKNKKEEYKMLKGYLEDMEFNDENNREGHAAKVYFNALFGKGFSREEKNPLNAALDYGYSIVLSMINRSISSLGYITQLGIHHENRFNNFNLGSDLIEPLRKFIDDKVIELNPEKFDREEKDALISILEKQVIFKNKKYFFMDVIEDYCRSVIDAINSNNPNLIKFIEGVGDEL